MSDFETELSNQRQQWGFTAILAVAFTAFLTNLSLPVTTGRKISGAFLGVSITILFTGFLFNSGARFMARKGERDQLIIREGSLALQPFGTITMIIGLVILSFTYSSIVGFSLVFGSLFSLFLFTAAAVGYKRKKFGDSTESASSIKEESTQEATNRPPNP